MYIEIKNITNNNGLYNNFLMNIKSSHFMIMRYILAKIIHTFFVQKIDEEISSLFFYIISLLYIIIILYFIIPN